MAVKTAAAATALGEEEFYNTTGHVEQMILYQVIQMILYQAIHYSLF